MSEKEKLFRKFLVTTLVAIASLLILSTSNTLASFFQRAPDGAASTKSSVSHEIVISDLVAGEKLPSVAYNWKHKEYFVVWHTTWGGATSDIRAARVSASGQVIDTYLIFDHLTGDSVQPSVAYDPVNDQYLVVWTFDIFGNGSDWDIYGRFIPWDGPKETIPHFSICAFNTNQWVPKVAYGRAVEEFFVVWNNQYQNNSLPMYISGRRITAFDGTFPGNSSDLTINHATEQRVNPDVTYNLSRNEYLVVFDNTFDIFGMRMTGDISNIFGGEFGIATWPDAETRPATAACYDANQYFVTWQSLKGGTNYAIYGRYIAWDGSVGTVREIDDTTGAEINADVDCNQSGQLYLVAWETEYANATQGIWARIVPAAGEMEPQFDVVHPTNTASRTFPIVSGGDTNFLIAWENQRDNSTTTDIHGRMISPNMIFLPMAKMNRK